MKSLTLMMVIIGAFLCAAALAMPVGDTLPENQPETAAKEIIDEASELSASSGEEGHVRQARGSFLKNIISGIFNIKLHLARSAWNKTKSLFSWGSPH